MGDGFWSRPPAPNYVSPGIMKRPQVESDVSLPREPLTIGMIHHAPKSDAHIGLNAAKNTKNTGTSYDHFLHHMHSFSSDAVSTEAQFPEDGSKTLSVEGLPQDYKEQEVAHIFSPFDGFEEARLVNEDPNKVPVCFVDFVDVSCAMAALNALQGCKVDRRDPSSTCLRLQFAPKPADESP